ncbi:hypothetical protein C0J52_18896 [Blattella germanica]|nr:hypothetical protein C0J52_18896 [Blattella germanica]
MYRYEYFSILEFTIKARANASRALQKCSQIPADCSVYSMFDSVVLVGNSPWLKLGASFSSILVLKCTGFECLLWSRGIMTDSVLPLPVRFTCGQSAYGIAHPCSWRKQNKPKMSANNEKSLFIMAQSRAEYGQIKSLTEDEVIAELFSEPLSDVPEDYLLIFIVIKPFGRPRLQLNEVGLLGLLDEAYVESFGYREKIARAFAISPVRAEYAKFEARVLNKLPLLSGDSLANLRVNTAVLKKEKKNVETDHNRITPNLTLCRHRMEHEYRARSFVLRQQMSVPLGLLLTCLCVQVDSRDDSQEPVDSSKHQKLE